MQSMNLAPIALFAFNRPDHLSQTLSALSKNKYASESKLFIFCDGSRGDKDTEGVAEVRKVAKAAQGFFEVTVIEAPQNKGLAQSIIAGVSELSSQYGKVIVVEDDLVTSPFFLQYMNEGLEKYKNEEKIISLHGYMYPIEKQMEAPFFLRGADCWGWATWERGWKFFNPDAKQLLKELEEKKLIDIFDYNGAYKHTNILKSYISGKNNSWAIRWHASAVLANKLTLYPHISLVQNIGLDNSGTNCHSEDTFITELAQSPIALPDGPFEANVEGFRRIETFYRKERNIFKRIKLLIKRYF